MKRIILLALLCCNPLLGGDGKLDITVDQLNSSKGNVMVYLFDTTAVTSFPKQKAAFMVSKTRINEQTATLIIEDIPRGTYALFIHHDEDMDKELKTNFLKIPKEGIGFSNNVKLKFGPPKFENCAFQVDSGKVYLNIKPVYL